MNQNHGSDAPSTTSEGDTHMQVTNTPQISIKVFEITQMEMGKPRKLYVGALPADQLAQIADIDIYDASTNPQGYQRTPVEYRVKQVSVYVRNHEGILPTAILVNIREGADFKEDGRVSDGVRFGTLALAPGAKVWVVDGQHRLAGLRDAAARIRSNDSEASLGYDLPVVFASGIERYDEMRLFDIVNSRAKSVPTDLAAQILRESFKREGKAIVYQGRANEKDFRKAIGTKVAYHLNGTPGPWAQKIRLPNETRDNKHKPLQVNAIASSLEPALRDNYVRSVYEPENDIEWPTLCGLISTYWSALEQLMPEAFADIEHYSVQRTAGTYAFHQILPDVLYRLVQKNDFSREAFVEILSNLGVWVTGSTWHDEDNTEPLTRSTGMGAIRMLADKMRQSLPPVETPGLSMSQSA